MTRILAAALLLAAAARAGEPEPAGDAPLARTAVPSNGVDETPRRGTFAEASVGAFATVGGSRALSNAQPYLGLTVGRDLGAASSLFASVGAGASSNSCFQPATAGSCAGADSFGATFLEVGASTGTWLTRRLLLSGKLMGGMTLLSPGPFTRKDGTTVPDQAIAPHAGAGLGSSTRRASTTSGSGSPRSCGTRWPRGPTAAARTGSPPWRYCRASDTYSECVSARCCQSPS